MKEVLLSVLVASVIGGIFLYTAFHQSSRGPVFAHDKGVYTGPQQPPLDRAVLEKLRQRAVYQAAPSVGDPVTGASFIGLTGGNVRIPDPKENGGHN